jgi:ABC-type Na+ transport system ATPase subunit NatA
MIEARNLVKRYGSTVAVNDLSFSIRPGMVTGFLGPNGAGKTTTMRMILGLDAPTQGSVTVDGRSSASPRGPVRRHRGRHRLDAAGPPGRMMTVRARYAASMVAPAKGLNPSSAPGIGAYRRTRKCKHDQSPLGWW